jgi:hypothetical protein
MSREGGKRLPEVAAEAAELFKAEKHDEALQVVYDALNLEGSTPGERSVSVLSVASHLAGCSVDPREVFGFASALAQPLGCEDQFQRQIQILKSFVSSVQQLAREQGLTMGDAFEIVSGWLPFMVAL